MRDIKFDFNNMLSFNIGEKHGVTADELQQISETVTTARQHLRKLIDTALNRTNIGLEWANLPFQDKKDIQEIQFLGEQIACDYKNVLFLGIGGSYLGLKAAQDALCPPYYNEFSSLRKGTPRIYFEGNNLDPETINAVLANLKPSETFVVVISKSGETTETKVALETVERWLKQGVGEKYGRQILAITDPESGALRSKVNQAQAANPLSFRSLPLIKGVGGRYSELNMGLLHLAIIGVKIEEVLAGAKAMAEKCAAESIYENPAYMYAVLQHILYKNKNKSIAVTMPFSEGLKATADWYAQLLAESLGKKYEREISVTAQGFENWDHNKQQVVNVGRTPVACRGTNDLHSIQQNNVEGENNKTVTFIRVENFSSDVKLPPGDNFLSGKSYSELIKLAQEATEWSLVKEQRPNCTIIIPEVSPYSWGELIFFFEMATAFEGELLNVNAYDQPGVEGYKKYMYYKLDKPGISKDIAREIEKYPIWKKDEFIF